MIDNRLAALAFINAIKVLGELNVRLLLQELGQLGVYLDDHDLNLHRLSEATTIILGESAASLIFERFVKELDKLNTMPRVSV
jgi:hypothetical protein